VDLIAVATLNLVLAVNPEIIVIGGDIYEMPGVQERFVRPLAARLKRALPFVPPVIELSSLGAGACLRGASIFAVESLLSGKYPFAVDYSKVLSA
jgi:predicted NBD/HSP70 family sugar kinase